jgi:hypothetical protein
VTRDNGKTWTNITPKDLPEGGRVAFIEASPHRKGSAYYATYRYLLGDYQPYIYSTNDYGKTWTRLTDGKNGIPADWPTRVVREDPDREGLLYAGTEFGLFISFDNGTRWQPFLLNMPNVPINDIKVHRKDLVVATQGRAMWILDNLSVLHQINPQVTTSEPFLYKPRDGYRTRVSPNVLGPMIEYFLPSEPADAVTIEILDSTGAVVNSYNSNAPAGGGGGGRGGRGGGGGAGGGGRAGGGGGDPDDPDNAMMAGRTGRGGGGPAARVTKTTGVNRFVWNGQHSSGLPAPPGAYQVKLTAAGKSFTQPFNLLIDPRLAAEGLTAADLKEQFDHNTRMRELQDAVNQTVARLREAQTKLKGSGASADRLKQLDVIAGKLLTEPVRYGKPGLQQHVTYLAGMTTAVDQKVGRDALERYAVLKKEHDAIRAELDKLIGG